MFDVRVEGDQSKAIVAYLLEHSSTFRDAYNKIDADHSVTLTIKDLTGDAAHGSPSQFTCAAGGSNCAIYFSAVDLNQSNVDLLKEKAGYVMTAASVMGHEMGHAAGHFSGTTGVNKECAGDPPKGGTGCVVEFENKVRSELPKNAQGGVRTKY